MFLYLLWLSLQILLVGIAILKLFSKLTMGWCKSNTCLVGKIVIITGGTSGIGYETALALASRGAKIIIADVTDTRDSVEKITKETQNSNVKGKFLDLASLDSVRKFCKEICEEEERLDILINNAGVGGMPLSHTKDGLQIHMQINYFGHFLLTHLLIGLLKRSESRIIFVSSYLAFFNNLTLENLNNPTIFSSDVKTHYLIYCNSKTCEIIASNVFAEKLKNTSITSNAVHPGVATTSLVRNTVGSDFHNWGKFLFQLLEEIAGKTPYEGAQTQINCALSKDLKGVRGEFFIDCMRFYQPSLAKDKEFCRKIWKMSEDLVKLSEEEKLQNIL